MYKHLTQEERYHISALKQAKFSQKYIANEIGVSEATISRELKRNSSSQTKSYSAKNAHKVAIVWSQHQVSSWNSLSSTSGILKCFFTFSEKKYAQFIQAVIKTFFIHISKNFFADFSASSKFSTSTQVSIFASYSFGFIKKISLSNNSE